MQSAPRELALLAYFERVGMAVQRNIADQESVCAMMSSYVRRYRVLLDPTVEMMAKDPEAWKEFRELHRICQDYDKAHGRLDTIDIDKFLVGELLMTSL